MRTHNGLYPEIYSMKNLVLALKRARKGKTQKDYVIEFERELGANLKSLHEELKNQTYRPKPLKTFILRDPKIRKISKSDFRDRVVHHALVGVIEPIFERLSLHSVGRQSRGRITCQQQSSHSIFAGRTVARRRMDVCDMGRTPRGSCNNISRMDKN